MADHCNFLNTGAALDLLYKGREIILTKGCPVKLPELLIVHSVSVMDLRVLNTGVVSNPDIKAHASKLHNRSRRCIILNGTPTISEID